MEENTEKRVDLTLFSEKIQALKDRIATVIVGQEQIVDLVLTAVLANGHVLLEGVPGVAKTLLARLVARLIKADFSRIQFTTDLMPSDVLGTTVFNMKTNDFGFHQGPVFADLVLVDEINRAPAKTQAALFEVMEERQVSIDGTTHQMGELYTILATQNPVEQEGTYKLPGAPPRQCFVGEVGEPGARAHKRRTAFVAQADGTRVCRPHAASVHRVDCTADAYQQGCIFRSFSACVRGNDAGLQGICTVAGT